MDRDIPKPTLSSAEIVEPKHTRLRGNKLVPMQAKSSTEREKHGPSRVNPGTNTRNPIRTNDWNDIGGPMWARSNANRKAPKREKICKGNGKSRLHISNTNIEESDVVRPDTKDATSKRANLCNNNMKPECK